MQNLQELIPAFFIGAGGAKLTPEQIAQRQQVAQGLLEKATDTSPTGGGWASIASKGLAGFMAGRNRATGERAATANAEENSALGSKLLSIFGGGAGATPMADTQGPIMSQPPSDMTPYRDAIASIESKGSGDYNAIGPTHSKLGRALGRYQIMEANIPVWSQEVLGRPVSADEFMANPSLQDAIFDGKFSSYVSRYGPEGAAQAWLGGPGGVGKLDRKDSLGTSISEYGQRFTNALGQGGATSMSVAETLTPPSPTRGAAPMANAGGLDPALVQALTDPTVSPENRQMAQLLLQNKLGERNAAQERAMTEQEQARLLAQRQGVAQRYGFDPALAQDEIAYKASVEAANRARQTATVNGVVIDTQTGKPIFEAPQPDPTSVQEYNFYAQQAQASGQQPMPYNDWSLQKTKAGASQFNMGGGSDKQVFDVMNEGALAARSAATGLKGLQEARNAIQQGGIFGAGADFRLGLAKLGTYFGLDPEQVVNTETFRAAIAPQIAATMKATVGSTNISNTDREFAQQAAGGSINLDAKSITRLLDIMERASNDVISMHQKRLDDVYPDPTENRRERALFSVQMPVLEPAPIPPQGGVPTTATPTPAKKRLKFNPATGALE